MRAAGTLSGKAPLPFYAVFSRPNGGQLLISSYRSKMNKIQPLRTEPFLIGIRYTGKQTGRQKKIPPFLTTVPVTDGGPPVRLIYISYLFLVLFCQKRFCDE